MQRWRRSSVNLRASYSLNVYSMYTSWRKQEHFPLDVFHYKSKPNSPGQFSLISLDDENSKRNSRKIKKNTLFVQKIAVVKTDTHFSLSLTNEICCIPLSSAVNLSNSLLAQNHKSCKRLHKKNEFNKLMVFYLPSEIVVKIPATGHWLP